MDKCFEVDKRRKKLGINDKKCRDIVSEDRLSSLPDCLLVDMLSLFPIHQAVATSVLSHRWRYLWTQVTNVQMFTDQWWDSYIERNGNKDCNSLKELYCNMNGVLKQLTSPKIRKFTFCFPKYPNKDDVRELCDAYVESWFSHIYDHRSPEEVEVLNVSEEGSVVSFPRCFFVCPSLVSLTIEGSFKLVDDCGFFLPSVKQLYISRFEWKYNPRISKLLFKSCPALERLQLNIDNTGDDEYGDELYFEISCPNLKHLVLILSRCDCRFVINLPRLEYMKLYATLSSFQFVECPTGLLEAHICLMAFDKRDSLDSTLNIVKGISFAKSLNLDLMLPYLADLYQWDIAHLPLFNNLTCLQVYGRSKLDFMIYLLHCPNLEFIEMQCTYCCIRMDADLCTSTCVPQCLSSKLKRIRLRHLKGKDEEVELLEYVLVNGKVLELLDVEVYLNGNRKEQMFHSIQYSEKLFSFQRSSKYSEIKFRSCYFSSSSKARSMVPFVKSASADITAGVLPKP